jgi:hypothetical protein
MVIAIGALGGSGTRVVAEIISQLGVYIGDDLNNSVDNLLYTRLFKNINWYKNATPKERDKRHLIFEKCMTGKKLSFNEKVELFKASKSNIHVKSSNKYYKNIFLGEQKLNKNDNEHWGWKEPNCHIYMEDIHRVFKNIKYIYVIRHGLDMAYSKNIQQLENWGFLYNLELKESDGKGEIAVKQLEYWIKSSEKAIQTGNDLFKENFYILNHQNLSLNPSEEIDKLVNFLGVSTTETIYNQVVGLPKIPATNERYKKENLNIFSKNQIEKVESFGFSI